MDNTKADPGEEASGRMEQEVVHSSEHASSPIEGTAPFSPPEVEGCGIQNTEAMEHGTDSHPYDPQTSGDTPMAILEGDADQNNADDSPSRRRRCCQVMRFGGVQIAQGYNILGTGRGCLVMSNIFLATSLTYLASEHVGCVTPDPETGEDIVEDHCQEKVFGLFRPTSLITNIAVIWGVSAALFMPLIGAIIDYSPHRWKVGVTSAALLMVINCFQIGTNSSTWFYMALLQAVSGFLYQVQNLTTYAYLPNIARTVGEEAMTKCKLRSCVARACPMSKANLHGSSNYDPFLCLIASFIISDASTTSQTRHCSPLPNFRHRPSFWPW